MSNDNLINKIAKILNQAERASTEAEADAFLKAAQALSTKYSVDLATARQATQQLERREDPEQREIDLTDVNRNNRPHAVYLYHAIAESNDIKINIRHDSTGIIAFGFPSDLDVTDALFVHLLAQMIETGNAFIRSGAHKSETTYDYRSGTYKPVDGRVARANFNRAFYSRIATRLSEAREEALASISTESSGTDLVLLKKADEVNAFYASASNARGSYRGGRTSGHSAAARRAGDEAGSRARLSGQGAISGGRKALTS